MLDADEALDELEAGPPVDDVEAVAEAVADTDVADPPPAEVAAGPAALEVSLVDPPVPGPLLVALVVAVVAFVPPAPAAVGALVLIVVVLCAADTVLAPTPVAPPSESWPSRLEPWAQLTATAAPRTSQGTDRHASMSFLPGAPERPRCVQACDHHAAHDAGLSMK